MITLGIIGVVSAVTLPTLMSNSQYKQIGVRLSKFASTTENAARAWVAANEDFPANYTDIENFINDSFLIKNVYNSDGTVADSNYYNTQVTDSITPLKVNSDKMAELKDGTRFYASMGTLSLSDVAKGMFSEEKYGSPRFTLVFDHHIKGLPEKAQKYHFFEVTSKGFVIPADKCTFTMYNDDWNVTKKIYEDSGLCKKDTDSWVFEKKASSEKKD